MNDRCVAISSCGVVPGSKMDCHRETTKEAIAGWLVGWLVALVCKCG